MTLRSSADTNAAVYRNTIVLSASSYASAAFNLAATALLARALNVEGFGALNAALVAAFLAFQMGELGVATIFTKRVAQDHERGRSDFGHVFSLRLVLGGSVLVLLVLAGTVVTALQASRLLLLLIGIAVLFEFLSEVPLAILRGYQRMTQQAVAGLVESTVVLAGSAVWLVASRAEQRQAAVGLIFVGGAAARLVFSLWAVKLRPLLAIDSQARVYWSHLLAESTPVGMSNLLSQLMLRMSVLFIVFFRGDLDAGLYSPSYVIFSGLQILWTSFLMSLFPHAAAVHARDIQAIWPTCRRAGIQLVALTIATGAGVLLLGEPIVAWLFGSEYLDTLRVLPLLVGANVFLALTSLCGAALTVIGEARVIPRAQVLALCLNVVLDIVLIQRMGFIGAGVGMFASQAVLLLILLGLLARTRAGAMQMLAAR